MASVARNAATAATAQTAAAVLPCEDVASWTPASATRSFKENEAADAADEGPPSRRASSVRPRTISSAQTAFLLRLSQAKLDWSVLPEPVLCYTLSSIGGVCVKAMKTLLLLDTTATYRVSSSSSTLVECRCALHAAN